MAALKRTLTRLGIDASTGLTISDTVNDNSDAFVTQARECVERITDRGALSDTRTAAVNFLGQWPEHTGQKRRKTRFPS